MAIIGTCSNCGGAVETVNSWLSTVGPPPPRCVACGYVMKNPFGPVINMVPGSAGQPPMKNPLTFVKDRIGATDTSVSEALSKIVSIPTEVIRG